MNVESGDDEMADKPKQDKQDKPVAPPVDAAPDENAPTVTPDVNWNSAPTKPKRVTQDDRKRMRDAARQERQAQVAARKEEQAATPKPPRGANLEETRTITITLPTRAWARWDKALERSGEEVGEFLRRRLIPQLR